MELSNTTSNKSHKSKFDVRKTELQKKRPEITQPNKKLVTRNGSSTLQTARAKQLPSVSNVIMKPNQKSMLPTTSSTKMIKMSLNKKPNAVLDTPHNVTVCSPPPKKKSDNDDRNTDNSKFTRKMSKTLAPDEVVILKRETSKLKSEEKVKEENLTEQTLTTEVKDSVAFEIKFENKIIKEKLVSHKNSNRIIKMTKNEEELDYSDDFESYESDFETDSSTNSLTNSYPNASDNNTISKKTNGKYIESKLSEEIIASDEGDHEDNTEGKQNATAETARDKENQNDSGHYDIISNKTNTTTSSNISLKFIQPKLDSLENLSIGISEELDSGISTCTTSILLSLYNKNTINVTYGGYIHFYNQPIINKRGSDLMAKIQFDFLSFTLIDLKPISYDVFMKTFAKLSTNQMFTQTICNQINMEQQTEVQETRSIWTQHPPQFYSETPKNFKQNESYSQSCCGEIINEHQVKFISHCSIQQSLNDLNQLKNLNYKRNYQNNRNQQTNSINYENLNSFLLRTSFLLDQIFGSSNVSTKYKPYDNDHPLKQVYKTSFNIDTNFLNTLQVLKLFSNNKYNLFITVHESLPDTNVYNSDFTNILMVWSTNTCDKPIRLLTTWSQVSKVEISNDSSDIIVAALTDGSISLWDLRETHSFCSKLDGYLTHFAATQSLVPSWCEKKNISKMILDLGACLDIKSFRSQYNNALLQTKFSKTQFVSLHDSGIVTVWTLVETSERGLDLFQIEKYKQKYSQKFTHTFDYTSPWARVKLMQSSLVNIKDYLETKLHNVPSRFDKTKTLFQKNIYSDEALKELNEYITEVGQQGLRFTSLECGSENLFILTNRNYILMCSRTLKMTRLKRITINESQYLFPTALKVLNNENFLAVGLSNGLVIILNCQTDNKYKQNKKIIKTSTFLKSESDSSFKDNAVTSKSCTVQNIILNVQKSYKEIAVDREYRPSTAACITLIETKKKPFELRIFDQQIIFNGSVLRKNLIQSIEQSSDGRYLFALTNGHVRIYNFYVDQEIPYEESNETNIITDIAAGKWYCKENTLIILKSNSRGVLVNILNN